MNTATRNVTCSIPSCDFALFKRFADSMGWEFTIISDDTQKKETRKTKSMEQDMAYILTLHAEGGQAVPVDEDPMDALTEAKFFCP